ncbi:hypothetical protein [Vibrio sp. PID23_8]|uniref:hypothetical protein n=1 Tax=Vibrio sp. PID23_8 TaxID=1583767 RepID=UPI001C727833|nr:hypothetical protein [Vibrio sp. PID23_8]
MKLLLYTVYNMLLEAYTPRQLEYKTGGPPNIDMMMDSTSLQHELAGLDIVQIEETVRDIREGQFRNE